MSTKNTPASAPDTRTSDVQYKDWVREYMSLGKSLGFVLTPGTEIEGRVARLRQQMGQQGMKGILVVQKMDLYYLSGTTQNSFLFIPLEGSSPLLMVKRELERAKIESPLDHVVGIDSVRQLPSLIQEHCGKIPETIGLEMDVLPVTDFFRMKDLFPNVQWLDASPIIKDIRKIKSPLEIGFMRKAAAVGTEIFAQGRKILKEGMTELEFGGLLETVAKKYGHEGLLRARYFNFEAYTWHVLSGPNSSIVSQSASPVGGLGLSPAFPVGASYSPMKAHDPIVVDYGTCYHGYQGDQTRVFSIGKLADKFLDAYQACREIYEAVLDQTKPGADCDALFQCTLPIAEQLGYKDYYLGPAGLQTRFIAHGIGLELSEPPFLAEGQHYPLEEGMIFAIEPKIVFPGEGSVGLENMVLVTENGYEILTPYPLEIIEV